MSVNPNGSYSQITIKDTDGVDHQFNTVVEAIGAVSSGTIDVSSPDAVMYADSSHSLITLDNDGTRITNVAEGTAPGDAVNKGQMDSAIDASRTHYYSVNSTDTPNRNNEGATGADAIAAGMHAEAKGDNSVAIGHDSKAGHSDTTGGLAGIAVGYTADVRDDYGIAMGVGSRSFADHASAIGHDARADGLSSVALGHNASVEVVSNPSADDGIAIGTNSHVIADQGTAIGKNAWAYAGQAQAFGNEAKADENATRGVALGDHATTGSVDSYAIGTQATGGAADGFAIGSDATTSGSSSYAIGHTAHSQGTNSFAVGTQAQTGNQAADSIAMGTESTVIGRESIAVGANNTIGQTDTDGDGNPILVGNRSGAFGNDNTIMQDNTFVVGNDVTTTQANSVVLGNASADREATEETGMTLYGQTRQFAGVGSVDQGVVSVGAVGAERQIINVAAGEISAISTDAINGSQLFQTNQALDDFAGDMATYLGGGASHDPNGAVTPPTYTLPDPSNVGGTADYHNVGDALSGLANAGLNFQGDQSGALGFVHRNIGDTLALSGGQSDSNALSRNPNIGVIRNVAGDGYDILLAKDLEGLGNVTVGADGKDGLAGLDGTDGLPGVSLKGEEGAIGMTGMDGTSADITLITGVPGVDGVPGTDGLTRIVYEDVDGNEHTVATHDDGLRFSGNENPGAGYITRTLNKELPIMGGATTAGDYSSANIKTVTTQDGGIEIQMAETPFFQGADMGGEKITNVAPGTDATDAVNLGQLQQSTFNAGQNGPVVYTDADGNKVAKANDGNWYDASVVNPDGSLIGLPTQVTEVIASMQSADGSTIDPTTLANVAAGKASTDAVNVSQLGAALGGDSIDADGNYVGPTYNVLGSDYNNVGDAIAASTTHYYSVNGTQQDPGSNYLNDGATGTGALAAGVRAQAAGDLSTAVGVSANSVGERSAAVGYDSTATGERSIAIGASARAQQSNSVALGAGSVANEGQHTGPFTLNGSTAAGLNSDAGVVSIGSAGAERQIQNVAPGVLSATSTDAINGSQLFATNVYLGNVATTTTGILGGNAALDADGNITMTDIGGTGENTIDDAIRAAGTAANAGWNYTAGGDAGTQTNVGPDDDVDFGNEDGNVVVSKSVGGLSFDLAPVLTIGPATGGNPVTIDGQTGIVSGLTNTTFDATDPGQYSGSGQAATEGQLHDLAVAGLDFAGDTGSGAHRDLGQTLTVQGGATGPLSSNNIGVNADGDTLTVQLAENIDLGPDGSITTGDTVMNGSGVTVDDGAGNSSKLTTGGLEVTDGTNTTRYGADGMTIDGGPSVTSGGIDAGNKQVTGMASGMTDAAGNAVTNLDDAVDTNAANIGDLKQVVSGVTDAAAGGGFGLVDQDGNAFMQNLGEAIAVVGDNQNISTGVVDVDPADPSAGKQLQVSLADQLSLGKQESAPGAGDGEDGSLAVRGQDGVAGVGLNGADGSISLTNADGDTASLRVVQGPANLDDAAAGSSQRLEYTDANGDPQQMATLNDGLVFGANDGADHSAKLNTRVNVMGADANTDFSQFDGGANIMTQMQGDTVRVALARDLGVDSVNAGGTVIDSDGLYFVDAQGGRRSDAPSIAPQGVDAGGHKITNVAPGTDATDAVNVAQLGTIQRHVTEGQVMYDQNPDGSTNYESVTLNPYGETSATVHNVAPGRAGTDAVNVNQLNALNNKIVRNDRRASAGIAAAIATAGLPQAYLPGKSMFGVAAGTWRGETGFAMGLSRVSDNGRWIIKGTATGSSRGDYGGSVGVGFQW